MILQSRTLNSRVHLNGTGEALIEKINVEAVALALSIAYHTGRWEVIDTFERGFDDLTKEGRRWAKAEGRRHFKDFIPEAKILLGVPDFTGGPVSAFRN